jgi:hypothetical protein
MAFTSSTISSPLEAFKEIKELGFLSYYTDFKLILCSICNSAIVSSSFKDHLNKHIKYL